MAVPVPQLVMNMAVVVFMALLERIVKVSKKHFLWKWFAQAPFCISVLILPVFPIVESKCFPLNPCQHGGTCHEDDIDYKCACTPGWDGISCESKNYMQ